MSPVNIAKRFKPMYLRVCFLIINLDRDYFLRLAKVKMCQTEVRVNSNFICVLYLRTLFRFLNKICNYNYIESRTKGHITIYHIDYKLFQFLIKSKATPVSKRKVSFSGCTRFQQEQFNQAQLKSSCGNYAKFCFALVLETLPLKFMPTIYSLTLKGVVCITSSQFAQRDIGSV